jgi:hypothetical protein
MAGLAGVAALARYLARRERAKAAVAPSVPATDPADELRRKLSESRSEPSATDEPVDVTEPPESLEERRARVHAKAEAAIAEMQEPPT